MLNFIFLLLGVGGIIVSALTLTDRLWKWGIIVVFGAIGLLGVALIVRDWWSEESFPPKFKLAITGLNIEHGFAEDPMKCRYLITGSIENIGDPSIAKNWALEIEPPKKKKYKALRLIIRPDLVVGIPGGKPRQLTPAQSLSTQTGNQDVKGTVDGYEWFEATPLSKEDANDLQTRLTLSVQDKFNKTYSLSFLLGELKAKGHIE